MRRLDELEKENVSMWRSQMKNLGAHYSTTTPTAPSGFDLQPNEGE